VNQSALRAVVADAAGLLWSARVFGRRRSGWRGPAVGAVIFGVVVGTVIAAGIGHRRHRAGKAATVDPTLVVTRLYEEPWKGNWDVIDELVSADYVGHDPTEPEPIRGREALRESIEKYVGAFPGGTITIEEQITDGDRVATRWTARGTHMGEIAGIGPTGKEVTVSGVTIARLEGGIVAEEWATWDSLGLLIQLGAIPVSAQSEVR
jgi:steroid delta-isomerase-like uncharacterized protein